MDIGTIGFKDQKAVIKIPHVERNREIQKRLEKSKTEEFPDFAGEKERHMHELMLERKKKAKEAAKAKKREVEEARAAKEARSYDKISTFLACPFVTWPRWMLCHQLTHDSCGDSDRGRHENQRGRGRSS
jgi:hypothetical protein